MRRQIAFKAQSDTLAEYWNSRKFLQFIMGPVGSAKTSTSIWKCFKMMIEQEPNAQGVRPTRGAVIRNTRSDLKATTIPDWRDQLDDHYGTFTWGPPPIHELRFSLPDGTRVEADVLFLGLDYEEDVRKIRGANWTWCWHNEIKEQHPAVLRMTRTRLWRFPSKAMGEVECSHAAVIADYNAPDEDHWLYKMVENNRPDEMAFFRQPPAVYKADERPDLVDKGCLVSRSVEGTKWVVNPDADNAQNLKPTGQQYYVNQIGGNSDDKIKVDLGNQYGYVQEGKPVYPEFNDSTHVADVPADPNLPLLLGWDFGLTPSVIIGQMSKRGQLRILDELCEDNMGVKRFARDVVKPHLAAQYKGYEIGLSWGDPANTRGDADEKRAISMLNDEYFDEEPLNLGFWTEPAEGNNMLTPRLESVRGFLNRMIDGAPGFLLHPKCVRLRQGFNGKYCYRRAKITGHERYHDKPDKNEWSHPHDALQYLALGAAGGYVRDDSDDFTVDFHEDTRDRHAGY